MTKVDDPMPNVAMERVLDHLRELPERSRRSLSGRAWLRRRLSNGRYGMCGDHYHAECQRCGSVKCVGADGYSKYERVDQRCDCAGVTEHLVVPFDNFGQHVGFP
jgi:hypothetical protein